MDMSEPQGGVLLGVDRLGRIGPQEKAGVGPKVLTRLMETVRSMASLPGWKESKIKETKKSWHPLAPLSLEKFPTDNCLASTHPKIS